MAGPERIVYVSCDPGTLARDIKYLTANGYEFVECTPVDQFPWTTHIETVCLLSNTQRKKKESYITLDVEMEDYYRIKNEGKNSTT
jgi:23S rRNA (uracil1939-C5)-methyltransferase